MATRCVWECLWARYLSQSVLTKTIWWADKHQIRWGQVLWVCPGPTCSAGLGTKRAWADQGRAGDAMPMPTWIHQPPPWSWVRRWKTIRPTMAECTVNSKQNTAARLALLRIALTGSVSSLQSRPEVPRSRARCMVLLNMHLPPDGASDFSDWFILITWHCFGSSAYLLCV